MKNILFFIRITKGLFVRMKLHVIVEPFSWFLENLLYLSKFSKWKSSVKRPEFDDFFNGKVDYNNRYKLYKYVLNKEELDQGINYLEFGVAHGNSFIWWMQNNKNPNSRFTGF
ncbi:MAG: hypothetical protein ACM3MI_13890, partial [Clostridiales bacterium]